MNRWLPLAVGGAALVVVVVITVAVSGRSPQVPAGRSPQATAELVAQAMSGHDVNSYRSALCPKHDKAMDSLPESTGPVSVLAMGQPLDDGVLGTLRSDDENRLAVDYSLFMRMQSADEWCLNQILRCPLVDDRPDNTYTPCGRRPGLEPWPSTS